MKKLVISILLCLSIIVTGCGSKGSSNKSVDAKSNTNDKEGSIVTEPGTFPIVKNKITLKGFAAGDSGNVIPDINDNWFTKFYEEKTNVHINWEYMAGTQSEVTQKINLKMSSGDLPDFFAVNGSFPGFSKSMQVTYGSQGLIVPVNDLIDKYSINLKKALVDAPEFKKAWTTPNGKIYGIGSVSQCFHCTMSNKMWVYQPWMDKLSLNIPTTPDEFYKVLKEFKEKDPNGNGKQDEVPLPIINLPYLISPYIYYDGSNLMQDGGKVIFVADKPEFKQALQYIRKLYSEKLIAQDYLTMDSKQQNALALQEPQIMGAMGGLFPGMYDRNEGSRRYNFTTIPPLKGPNGLQQINYITPTSDAGVINITKVCKYPEVVVRWIDWIYTTEGFATTHYGPERSGPEENKPGWYRAKEGQVGADGKAAVWTRIMYPNTDSKYIPNLAYGLRVLPSYQPFKNHTGMIIDLKANYASRNDIDLYEQTAKNYDKYKVDKTVPSLYMSDQANADIAELSTVINKTINEAIAQFITGSKNIDTDWDSYVSNLKKMGLDKYITIYQQEYDKNNKK